VGKNLLALCGAREAHHHRGERKVKYVLVLWLSVLNNTNASYNGSLTWIPMESMSLCQQGLETVRKAATYVHGVCIPIKDAQ
jgi:hypothetical protein